MGAARAVKKTPLPQTALRRDIHLAPVQFEGKEVPDYVGMGIWYAEQAASAQINVCKWVQLAAKRFLKMLGKAEKGTADYYWSPDHVIDVCNFIEKIPQVEGYSGNFEVQPWQCFLLCAVFGFRRYDTGYRLVRYVYIFVPRKNGKSSLTAALIHYVMTSEGEIGPLGYIGAATKDQADKVYVPCRNMADAAPDLIDHFKISSTQNKISYGANNGVLMKLTKIGDHNDGHNPSLFVAEELHAQEYSLFEVMRSAFGARKNPLLWSISTAGRSASGLGYEKWKSVEAILLEKQDMDATFGLIYAPDFKDIYTKNGHLNDKALLSERVIASCNPNFGISVDAGIVQEFAKEVKGSVSSKAEFYRTRLNVWAKQAGNLIDSVAWAACEDKKIKIESYKGQRCWVGCDLASRNDLAVVSIVFQVGRKTIYFWWCYICEGAPAFEDDRVSKQYRDWQDKGHLIVHEGGLIDFNEIRRDVEKFCDEYEPEAIGVDDYQANQFATELVGNGYPVLVFRKNAKSYTEPTDDFTARIMSKDMVHDGNPVAAWCAGNVVANRDVHDQVLPKKDMTLPHMKIDCIDAAITANAMRIAPGESGKRKHNPYLKRGLLGADGEDQDYD
jgi:phage terminase large subunit-like protein